MVWHSCRDIPRSLYLTGMTTQAKALVAEAESSGLVNVLHLRTHARQIFFDDDGALVLDVPPSLPSMLL